MDLKFSFRLLLLPFSWIYGFITHLRNLLYSIGIFHSFKIPKKSICVGNLSIGGTGKTPHVDLLVDLLLSKNKKVAVLSRGYGRKAKGLIEVKKKSIAIEVGDEPLFYKKKHGDNLTVVVAEKRKIGVDYILKNNPKNDIIVLDDAFQHRAVKAGLNILITEFNRPFYSDFVLPAGNLREFSSGKRRTDIIIVSKSPDNISKENEAEIRRKIGFNPEKIFFSKINYQPLKCFNLGIETETESILLITGIANPTPLMDKLKKNYSVTHLNYPDHHTFNSQDIAEIHQKFDTFATGNKIIVTTEKDFMRLKDIDLVKSNQNNWFYQPIITTIKEETKFNQIIYEYCKV